MKSLLRRIGITVLAVFVVASCGITWYLLIRGSQSVQTTSTGPLSKDVPKLTKEQADRVKARIVRHVFDRLAEEKKKWEASQPEKVTEDEFVASILP